MKLTMYQVDAFASSIFSGNPAAIIALDSWPDDSLLQAIASENNLSETYTIDRGERFDIRRFIPSREVDLCGHASLAAAFVVFECIARNESPLRIQSRSGELAVGRQGAGFVINFPAQHALPGDVADAVFTSLGARPPRDLECQLRYAGVRS